MTVLLLVSAGLAIYVVASVAQAVTGFGSALVAVPLLAFVVDPVDAVVATTIVSCVLSGWSFRKEREHADGAAVRTLVVTGIVGIPIGIVLLVTGVGRSYGLAGTMSAAYLLAAAALAILRQGRPACSLLPA